MPLALVDLHLSLVPDLHALRAELSRHHERLNGLLELPDVVALRQRRRKDVDLELVRDLVTVVAFIAHAVRDRPISFEFGRSSLLIAE